MTQELPPPGKWDQAMPSPQRTDQATEQAAPQKDFFIPDLCATRPVVLSIMLSELVVLVHVLGYIVKGHFLSAFTFAVCYDQSEILVVIPRRCNG